MCGWGAVRAQFEADAGAVQRLYFEAKLRSQVGGMCRALAQARKAYRCVSPEELEKVGGSVHHGGIVAVLSVRPPRVPAAGDVRRWARAKEPVLILDRVGNAHNLGALARSAAFFGVPRLVVAEAVAAARPSAAAYRVAEGGLSHVEVWSTSDLVSMLGLLREAGYDVVGAAARGGQPALGGQGDAPVALVLGNEEAGLSPEVTAACTRLVSLPGSGKVESLNVSVAGAVLIWELMVRRVPPTCVSGGRAVQDFGTRSRRGNSAEG